MLLKYIAFFVSLLLVCSPVMAAEKLIGVIMTANIPYYQEMHQAFLRRMAAQGLGEGTIKIALQTPAPDPLSWTNAARKFVSYEADLIICYGMPATLAVIKQNSNIPVVFAGVYYPHTLDLDGGNATGVSCKVPVSTVIQILRSIKNYHRLGIAYNVAERDTAFQVQSIGYFEEEFEFKSVLFQVNGGEDVEKIKDIDALLLTTCSTAMLKIDRIMAVTRVLKIPIAATIGGGEEKGVLLSIMADPVEQGSKAAWLAGKIIRGEKPSAIPVQMPEKTDMVINLKEARNMGLNVPSGLLNSATRIIK